MADTLKPRPRGRKMLVLLGVLPPVVPAMAFADSGPDPHAAATTPSSSSRTDRTL